MNKPRRIAIIGAGISGLAAAFYIEQRCGGLEFLEIDLIEASSRCGGKIETLVREQLILEQGAESFLTRKPHGIQLCRDLGIEERLRGTDLNNKGTFIWNGTGLREIPEGLSGLVPARLKPLFQSRLLTTVGKVRFLLEYIVPSNRRLEDESIASFIQRRFGRQAYENLIQPLLCGIYAGRGDRLSLMATFPDLKQLERKWGSVLRGMRRSARASSPATGSPAAFATFPEGMNELVTALQSRLKQTTIHLNTVVTQVHQNDSRYRFQTIEDSPITLKDYEMVILATPAFVAATVLRELMPVLSTLLQSIQHASTAVVNLWCRNDHMNHALKGYGFVVPERYQQTVTALTWTSSKHIGRAPQDYKLIRAFVGRDGQELDDSLSDEQIVEQVIADIRRTMQVDMVPEGYLVKRWIQGSPQYDLQHLARINDIERELTSLPGIALCGASYHGVGIPDCIRDGLRVAELSINYLRQTKSSDE